MILFYYGEDTFSLQEELKKTKQLFTDKHSAAGIEILQAETLDKDEDFLMRLRRGVEAQGLFAQKKLVIIRDFLSVADDLPKSQEYLLKLLESEPQDADLAIVQVLPFDRRRKIFKALQKQSSAKEFEVPSGASLNSWIEKYLQTRGFSIDQPAILQLIGKLGEEFNLWQVVSELEKLTLYATTSPSSPPHEEGQGEVSKKITSNMVRDVVSTNVHYDVFALTNSLAEGKAKEAMIVLDHLVEEGATTQKTQAIQIIGALSSQLHSLLAIKSLTGTASQKAAALGWKEGRVWINEKLAARFEIPKLKQLLLNLKQIDFRAKTSDEPVKLLLSLFIQKAKVS